MVDDAFGSDSVLKRSNLNDFQDLGAVSVVLDLPLLTLLGAVRSMSAGVAQVTLRVDGHAARSTYLNRQCVYLLHPTAQFVMAPHLSLARQQ